MAMRTRDPRDWIGVVAGALLAASPGDPARSQDPPLPKFVGVEACAKCHASEATGKQVQSWRAGAHARAWERLDSDEARTLAAARGVQEPQSAPECLRCHTTGAGFPKGRFAPEFKASEGVQCEACHGPGEFYGKIEHMIVGSKAREAGLVDPGPAVCTRCHNQDSPTFAGFDYKAAVKRIRHHLAAY
jgi:hypothetical protein